MTGVDEIFEQAINTVVANDRKTIEAAAASGSSKEGKSSSTTPGVGQIKRKKRRCPIL
jgi:hypothetical protein